MKEERFLKVQIKKNDVLLKIIEEKQIVIEQINEKQKEQLHKILLKYQDVIAKEGELGRT